MTKLSAIIITKNGKRAKKALRSVEFADEVLVREYPDIENFAAARNKALKKAKGEWILFIDDDEFVTKELKEEIMRAINNPKIDGYYLKRQDEFLGKKLSYGETGSVRLLRLARKNAGHFRRPVHEYWYIEGPKSELRNHLLHTPHSSITSFLRKINKYSSLDAKYRKEKRVKSSLYKIICYPAGKFLQNYIIKLGFLDGVPGAIMAFMMSFHSFQTWTKLYLLQNKK